MSHINFKFPDVKLLKKIWLNFIGQEGMKIGTIVDTADGCWSVLQRVLPAIGSLAVSFSVITSLPPPADICALSFHRFICQKSTFDCFENHIAVNSVGKHVSLHSSAYRTRNLLRPIYHFVTSRMGTSMNAINPSLWASVQCKDI